MNCPMPIQAGKNDSVLALNAVAGLAIFIATVSKAMNAYLKFVFSPSQLSRGILLFFNGEKEKEMIKIDF